MEQLYTAHYLLDDNTRGEMKVYASSLQEAQEQARMDIEYQFPDEEITTLTVHLAGSRKEVLTLEQQLLAEWLRWSNDMLNKPWNYDYSEHEDLVKRTQDALHQED